MPVFAGRADFKPGRSELTHPDPQGLVDEHAGTGVVVGSGKEVVDFGEHIGVNVDDKTGERTDTTAGTIHTKVDGSTHIVPTHPDSKAAQEAREKRKSEPPPAEEKTDGDETSPVEQDQEGSR